MLQKQKQYGCCRVSSLKSEKRGVFVFFSTLVEVQHQQGVAACLSSTNPTLPCLMSLQSNHVSSNRKYILSTIGAQSEPTLDQGPFIYYVITFLGFLDPLPPFFKQMKTTESPMNSFYPCFILGFILFSCQKGEEMKRRSRRWRDGEIKR